MQENYKARIGCLNDYTRAISDVSDAATAKVALGKATDLNKRLNDLAIEQVASGRLETADQRKIFKDNNQEDEDKTYAELNKAIDGLKTIAGVPAELSVAANNGIRDFKQAVKDGEAAPAVTFKLLPSKAPDDAPYYAIFLIWTLILVVLAVCTGFLYTDGLWGNAVRLVNVIFACLLAMNFYEPLAKRIAGLEATHSFTPFVDFLAIWVCFAFILKILLTITDKVSKVRVRFLKIVDRIGGIVLALWIGWVMVGFTFATLHTAPLGQYFFFGGFVPQYNMAFGLLAPDREWLGFTKRMSEGPYGRGYEETKFPNDFIEKHLKRRMYLESYINNNKEHSSLIQPDFFKTLPKDDIPE